MSNKKLHVLQVTGTMNRGGAEVMLMDIYRNLSSDVRFDFLINYKIKDRKPHGDFDNEITQLGGRLKYIGTQWDLGIFKYISEFKKIIHEIGKPDVVHIHLNSRCGGISLAARLCGIKKVIAHSHEIALFKGHFLNVLTGVLELKMQKILIASCATDYWGCSKGAIESLFYQWIINKGNTLIINNAINVPAFHNVSDNITNEIRTTYGLNENTIVIGNVGRVIRKKNLCFIIDILNIFNENNVDFIFVFAGRVDDKEYMNEIMNKAKEYCVDDKLLHLGDRDDIPAVMSTFDVFVASNQDEGFGMVAIEAQAAGLPCVLSDGFTQDIDMGLNLVSFMDNYDPRKWADAIIKSKGNRCTDKELIHKNFVVRGFEASENTRKIEQLYQA
jgi:glycosyltransferase EpsF